MPAIQRKFVWKRQQIEKLFDSIQQGYPIGTFLFWFVNRPHIDSYVFYKFLQNYHERDDYLNIRIPNPELRDSIIGVLDGQQRLSAIYLALQGTYSHKLPYYSWTNLNAFPTRKMHLNLFSNIHEDENNQYNYSFEFITEEASRVIDDQNLWFCIRDVLTWEKNSPPIDEFYDDLKLTHINNPDIINKLDLPEIRNRIKRTIRNLHSRLVAEELINYFRIDEQELDNISKIFVRVNSGGTILSKTDLLFSTIVASWEDGRDEIESFITTINKKGYVFNFNNDFVMRACLILTDGPVLFKVGSFRTENVETIKSSWLEIKDAIIKTVDLLVEFGLNGITLPSQNSVIPIAYYIMKGGDLYDNDKNEIKKFLFHAFLKKVFSGQGDTVLNSFRNALRSRNEGANNYILRSNNFSFDEMASIRLTANKSLRISQDDVEEFLNCKKGASAFLILSLLYPNLRYEQVRFHQDHIHPVYLFSNDNLNNNVIPIGSHNDYKENRDKLPNLQLLEGSENIRKNNTPFQEWLEENYNNINDRVRFLNDNYIVDDQLGFDQFLSFYENRKDQIRQRLIEILDVNVNQNN